MRVKNIEKQILESFGISIELKPYADQDRLPLAFREGSTYLEAAMDGFHFLLVSVDLSRFSSQGLAQRVKRIGELTGLTVAFCINSATVYQSAALLRCRIPFIIPGRQIYLPFLALHLKPVTKHIAKEEKLGANAQLLFLYLLYSKREEFTAGELCKALDLATPQISLAARELEACALAELGSKGRSLVIRCTDGKQALLDKARDLLSSPVARVRSIRKKDLIKMKLPLAGLSALSSRSMLAPPKREQYAVHRLDYRKLGLEEVEDPLWSEEDSVDIELWNYRPQLLSASGSVDPLSLYFSLEYEKDDRVQEELMSLVERETGWKL